MALTKITNQSLVGITTLNNLATAPNIVTDLSSVNADITALALREATNESSAAFNLPNQFIDTFTDDTNLGTQTTVDRISGYIASVYSNTVLGKFVSDSNTSFLLHSDATDGNTTFTDSSSNGHTISQGASGGCEHSTDYPPPTYLGATAIHGTGSGFLYAAASSDWNFGTGDWTMEFWQYSNGTPTQGDRTLSWADGSNKEIFIRPSWNQNDWIRIYEQGGQGAGTWAAGSYGSEPTTNTWTHFAYDRHGTTIRYYKDGVSQTAGGTYPLTWPANYSTFTGSHPLDILGSTPNGEYATSGIYITEMRISKGVSRYPSGTTFTPNQVTTSANNATGTLIQSANAVGSAKTKVAGTMLYKDNEGTATLGTDLKIYFTCDGGSNWTEAASYNSITPVYSTGIKQVRLGETTCTSGTDVRYKAVWANQSDGSKETQLHGIGVSY